MNIQRQDTPIPSPVHDLSLDSVTNEEVTASITTPHTNARQQTELNVTRLTAIQPPLESTNISLQNLKDSNQQALDFTALPELSLEHTSRTPSLSLQSSGDTFTAANRIRIGHSASKSMAELADLMPLERAPISSTSSASSKEFYFGVNKSNLHIVPESSLLSPSNNESGIEIGSSAQLSNSSPSYSLRAQHSPFGPATSSRSRVHRHPSSPFSSSSSIVFDRHVNRRSQTPSAQAMRMWSGTPPSRPHIIRAQSRQNLHDNNVWNTQRESLHSNEIEWSKDRHFLMSLIKDMQQERLHSRQHEQPALDSVNTVQNRIQIVQDERDQFEKAFRSASSALMPLKIQLNDVQIENEKLLREIQVKANEPNVHHQQYETLQTQFEQYQNDAELSNKKSAGVIAALQQVKNAMENRINELAQLKHSLGQRLQSMSCINRSLREQLQDVRLHASTSSTTVSHTSSIALKKDLQRHRAATLIQAHWRRWLQQHRYDEALFDQHVLACAPNKKGQKNSSSSRLKHSRVWKSLPSSASSTNISNRLWEYAAITIIASVSATLTFIIGRRFLFHADQRRPFETRHRN